MKHLLTTLALCITLALPLLAPSPTHAAASYPNAWSGRGYGIENDNSTINGSVSVQPYLKNAVYGQIMTIICWIIPFFGPDFCTNNREIFSDMMQKSAISGINNAIVLMYKNPPADTSLFIADVGRSLGFMPTSVYAQGVGFSGLSPLLNIWKAFRNIAYLLLAIVMIVIGFMVMLRKKIDPKTVVTVQNALPRIIITLILITFSYAIVGIMIDLMYLSIIMGIHILNLAGVIHEPAGVTNFISGGVANLFNAVFFGGLRSWDDLTRFLTGDTNLVTTTISQVTGQPANWGATALWAVLRVFGIGDVVFSIIIMLLLALTLLFGFVRIFLMLLSAYINVIIALMFGPIQILMDIFPGSNTFESWLKNLFANLVVFPVTSLLLLIGIALSATAIGSTQLWVPPMLSGATGYGTAGIIGLGMIMVIPTIANGIKEAIKAKPMIPAGAGAVVGPLAGGAGQIWNLAYQARMIGVWKGFEGKSGAGPKVDLSEETIKALRG